MEGGPGVVQGPLGELSAMAVPRTKAMNLPRSHASRHWVIFVIVASLHAVND